MTLFAWLLGLMFLLWISALGASWLVLWRNRRHRQQQIDQQQAHDVIRRIAAEDYQKRRVRR